MNWKLVYAHHKECVDGKYNTIDALEKAGFDLIPATVPGNYELDMIREGKLHDLYFSTNTLDAQKMEDMHVWYFCQVDISDPKQYLHFEGIDTFSDIYVNGKFVASTDNMFLTYDVRADWIIGKNEIVVHIKPTMLMARKFQLPAASHAQKYNYASLYVRKAAHMFGWDIMPRIVSAGLWKPVTIKMDKVDQIQEVYLVTNRIVSNECGKVRADLRIFINSDLESVFATEYSVRIEGDCGDSHFVKTEKLWHNAHAFNVVVEDCKLWWPKKAGAPNLYDITVTLLHGEKICDIYQFKFGIRTAELIRTDVTTTEGDGDFCFVVNGKRIFVLGTNWVPLDAFHSNDINRLPKAMELVDDIGCNMIRCWGGNVYESDEFFDYCDEHGIMVWQDFGMGCGVYPNEPLFEEMLEKEAIYQIKRLRNHASLILWAGDNECDLTYSWRGRKEDNPNQNTLTRKILKHAVELHDYSRSYLPSSPYISEPVFAGEGIQPEEHLWGPRDYFKGAYYKDTFCHFASETGYHGFPSSTSLKRFLREPEKIFGEDGRATEEYLVHAASMETEDGPYAYRIKLAYNQVVTLFGSAKSELDDFVRQSQISQAEAKKYFIEKFRIGKGKRTGIIWWNLLDGWPQISDAVVDYYFTKKLAYHYIKRSQEPVCLMFDEPENGHISLIGANDLPSDVKLSYTVKRIKEMNQEDELVMSGEIVLPADSSVKIDIMPIKEREKQFYLIEWNKDEKIYKNHFFTNIINIDFDQYMNAIFKCGMDKFEGF